MRVVDTESSANSSSEGVVATVFVPLYTGDVVIDRLKAIYKREIVHVIKQSHKLLPRRRTQLDPQAYRRDRNLLMLLTAYTGDEAMSVAALETSLSYLLAQQQEIIDS